MTSNPKKRLRQHLIDSIKTKTHLGCWLRSLLGVPPNFVVLSEVPEAEGSAEEIRYIAAARTSLGMSLVNATDGGEGAHGYVYTSEDRATMSAAHKGVPLSPAHRAALSAGQRGVPKSPRSPEHRAAMSAAKKGYRNSPETRSKMSIAQKKRRANEKNARGNTKV